MKSSIEWSHLVFFVCSILIVITQSRQLTGPPDNAGREFMLVFMENMVEDPNVIENLELFITTSKTSPVHYNISSPKYFTPHIQHSGSVTAGQVQHITINDRLRMFGTMKHSTSIWVTSTDDIVIYASNKEQYSNDAFLAFPTDVIGTEYYTVSYWPPYHATQFGIVARFDGTLVSIRFPNQTETPINVVYEGKVYTNGDLLQVTLDRFEAFQAQGKKMSTNTPSGDLTGTFISSNRPISVFSGNIRTLVGNGTQSRDHLAVQLPPVESWGRRFVTAPSPNRTVGDVVRIIASEENTVIEIIGFPRFTLQNAGNFAERVLETGSFHYIMATKPVLVAMISQSQYVAEEPGDPSMWLIPSIEQHGNDYTFSTITASTGQYNNSFAIVIQDTYKEGLQLDGIRLSQHPNFDKWTPIPSTPYTGSIFSIEAGAHNIKHVSPNIIFAGFLYGMADRESYGFQIGMRISRINVHCIPSQSVYGDGIDNDCDGRIDEELCSPDNNRLDDDHDGRHDEDCAMEPITRVVYPDTKGTEFILMYMENWIEEPTSIPLELFVTTAKNHTVFANVTSPLADLDPVDEHFNVTSGAVHKVEISPNLRPFGTGYSQRGILVQSSHEVIVYAINKEQYSNDAFLVLPTDTVGTDYFVVCYSPATIVCQFAVVGVSDHTQVSIEFPRQPYGNKAIEVDFYGKKYGNGDTFTFAIGRLQVVQIQSAGDLSGTRIRTTKRVAAFSGNVRTSVNGTSRDHLAVQLPPANSVGKEYITMPFPGRSTGDYFRIVTTQNNTNITISGHQDRFIHEPDAGTVVQLSASSVEYLHIVASQPILVVQISKSQESATSQEKADPTMLILPSVEQYSSDYTFATTRYSLGNYTNYVMITIRTGMQDGLYMDGQKLVLSPNTIWYNIPYTIFSVTSYAISDGVHTINHENPSMVFAVYVYGSADRESYGFAVGMRLQKTTIPCYKTVSVPGDGIDNDCDGTIDEELCTEWNNKQDDDNDGLIDEDCVLWLETTVSSVGTTSSSTTGATTTTSATTMSATTTSATTMSNPVSTTMTTETTSSDVPARPTTDGATRTSETTPSSVSFSTTASTSPSTILVTTDRTTTPKPTVIAPTTGSDVTTEQVTSTTTPGTTATQPPPCVDGPPGPVGPKGDVGIPGVQGSTGVPGAPGRPGEVGPRGYTGVTGRPGQPGEQGPPGPSGVKGQLGQKGQRGIDGGPGVGGPPGPPGMQGQTGPKGQPGIAGDKGDRGTQGSVGPDGPHGTMGVPGIQGGPGIQGPVGHKGDIGLPGIQGTKGDVGIPGPNYFIVANKTIVIDQCSRMQCESSCQNSLGGSQCSCDSGYQLSSNNISCINVNECLSDNGGCSHLCSDTRGRYMCGCPQGMALNQDQHTCNDVNECTRSDVCGAGMLCVNSQGSHMCINLTATLIDSGLMSATNTQSVNQPLALTSCDCKSTGTFDLMTDTIVIMVIVWLIALTLLLIILISCLLLARHEKRRDEKRRLGHIETMNGENKSVYFPTLSQRSKARSDYA